MVYSVAGYGRMLSDRVRIGACGKALERLVEVIQLTKVGTRIHDFADGTEFIQTLSTRIELPEQADATVADQSNRYAG